jgi:hypothetical protein
MTAFACPDLFLDGYGKVVAPAAFLTEIIEFGAVVQVLVTEDGRTRQPTVVMAVVTGPCTVAPTVKR